MTVELADLDWEDRETVLRLLFSKMNTGEPASCWRDPAEVGASRSSNRQREQHGASESGTSSGQQRHYGGENLNQGFRDDDQHEEGMMYYDEEDG